jgi:hypothetical protein
LRPGLGPRCHRPDLIAGEVAELILDVVPQLLAEVEKLFAFDVQLFRQLVDTLPFILCQAAPLLGVEFAPPPPPSGAARRQMDRYLSILTDLRKLERETGAAGTASRGN